MINMTKSIKAICIYDEAIDQERVGSDAIIKYIHTRDINLIEPHIKPGSKPVYYYVRRLPRSVMLRKIMPISSEHERAVACFQYGLERVENLPNDSGGTMEYMPSHSDGETSSYVKESEWERFDPCDVIEIGTMIWYMSFLRRNSAGQLAAPPTSLDIWARMVSLSAQQNQINAVMNSLKQPMEAPLQQSRPTEQMQGKEENSSEKAMDATAEESK